MHRTFARTISESWKSTLRILYLAHRIPYPPNKGEKTRCFYQLQYLAARHSVDLMCFADSAKEAEGSHALSTFCRHVHVETLLPRTGYVRSAMRLLGGLPASVAYYDSPAMHRAVSKAVSETNYDLIFVYCSSMAQFVPLHSKVPVVIDFVDADSAKWAQYARRSSFPSSWLYAREGTSLARYEKKVTQDVNLSLVATPLEALDLGGGGCRSVEVVPNGVTSPPVQASFELPAVVRQAQPYALFVGTMSYKPNADAVIYFAEEMFPLLRKTHPELRFLIVGRDPTRAVRDLARHPGIIVSGSVPDVHPYLSGAAVVVAPFRIAQGVQNKVLEALVAGVPVISTSRPARAIGGHAADILLVADTPKEFAASVQSVLENPEFRRRSVEAAPSLQKLLAWEPSLARMEGLLETIAGVSRETNSAVPTHA
ncbi:MAG: TIGR03087 family PEP-CTERM/XrtA system glycosyltransferase [Candidatus Acidiferrum sp.]